ncbi:ankyrin repeat-containing domain protein, partial [Pavlovales sp. CCMP2436]
EDDSVPLCLAAIKADLPAMRLLLKHNARVDVRSGRGRTPLHLAVIGGEVEVLLLLLASFEGRRASAMLETADTHGVTPLLMAVVNGDEAAVALLLDAGA